MNLAATRGLTGVCWCLVGLSVDICGSRCSGWRGPLVHFEWPVVGGGMHKGTDWSLRACWSLDGLSIDIHGSGCSDWMSSPHGTSHWKKTSSQSICSHGRHCSGQPGSSRPQAPVSPLVHTCTYCKTNLPTRPLEINKGRVRELRHTHKNNPLLQCARYARRANGNKHACCNLIL